MGVGIEWGGYRGGGKGREREKKPVMAVSKSLQSKWPLHRESMRSISTLLEMKFTKGQ